MIRMIIPSFLIISFTAVGLMGAEVPWPFLFANPEKPGDHPLEEMRQSMLARFDANKDGFLDKSEREAMRLDTKRQAEERSDWVRKLRDEEEEKEKPPRRWLELYDKNENGRIDKEEWDKARTGEMKRVQDEYDSDRNGALNDREKQEIIADLKRNSYHGYDAYIRREVSGLEEKRRQDWGRRNSRNGRGSRWEAFDIDGDGKASEDELKAMREHEAKSSKG